MLSGLFLARAGVQAAHISVISTNSVSSNVSSNVSGSGSSKIVVKQEFTSSSNGETVVREYRSENGKEVINKRYVVKGSEGERIVIRNGKITHPNNQDQISTRRVIRLMTEEEFLKLKREREAKRDQISTKLEEAKQETNQVMERAEKRINENSEPANLVLQETKQEVNTIWQRFSNWLRDLLEK